MFHIIHLFILYYICILSIHFNIYGVYMNSGIMNNLINSSLMSHRYEHGGVESSIPEGRRINKEPLMAS